MERRLTADEPISEWLHSLASTGANPGGGAAAALMAGMAAALVEMVVAYRKPHASPEEEIRRRCLEAFSAAMRETAPGLADQDAAASSGFAAASRQDAGSRSAAMRAASLAAAESSAALGRFAADLVPVLQELVDDTSTLLLADVGTAAATLAASTRAAALNVGTDLRLSGEDGSGRSDLVDAFDELEATTRDLESIVDRVRERVAPSHR